jgi:hypothetical protein
MIGKTIKGVKKVFKKKTKAQKAAEAKKKAAAKKAGKKKTVLGGAQKLAGKALLNPITVGGGAAGTIGYTQGKAVQRGRTNRLNEALRRRGVRV